MIDTDSNVQMSQVKRLDTNCRLVEAEALQFVQLSCVFQYNARHSLVFQCYGLNKVDHHYLQTYLLYIICERCRMTQRITPLALVGPVFRMPDNKWVTWCISLRSFLDNSIIHSFTRNTRSNV